MTTTEQLAQALRGMLAITEDSEGVAGYTLTGKVSGWRDFYEVDEGWDALAKYEAEKAQSGSFQNGNSSAAPSPGLIFTDEMRADLIRDTGEVFDRNGPETPQIVRDVIEYVDSALQVWIGRAHDKARAATAAPEATPRGDGAPIWSQEERRIGELLLAAWSKTEPAHGVTLHPVSYRATFCDMARAVLRDLAAQAEPVAARYDFDGYGYLYIDNGHGSDWQTRIPDAEMLYTKSDEAEIRADERERCAKLCEAISDEYQKREGMKWPELKTDAQEGAATCAHRIRERGQG